ncbi:terpene synthase family protein [Puia dinghuensis]|uniref:Terpene synthase n=1 Tax=Puia dinghuensis TaxID=1792502 RepID=A0A8J2UCW3_9BACT|nr:terpene synthase family protein [Puia dinghuensis]GGA98475.1 hypothetical protein GCM10011511_22220 [Puia dinghuensis]
MQLEPNVQAVTSSAMNRIQNEYARLISQHFCVSLPDLFDSEAFNLEDYCRDYHPHPQMAEMIRNVIGYGNAVGILLPNAEHYLTCALYLFPDAPPEKILLIARNYAVDFYLNDTMGREYRSTTAERQRLNEIRRRLAGMSDATHGVAAALSVADAAFGAERANLDVLAEIARTSPASWFEPFLSLYLKHLSVAHKSYDCISLGYIPKIEEYISIRADISGMPHTVSMIEYSQGNYLDWPLLEKTGLADDLRELNTTVALIGALMNDVFSFEKEVIDNRSDSNLLAIIVLNNFKMELKEALSVATTIVRNLLIEYEGNVRTIEHKITASLDGEQSERLQQYLDGIKKCVQTCWLWQVDTKRYKRSRSIWKETTLSGIVVA